MSCNGELLFVHLWVVRSLVTTRGKGDYNKVIINKYLILKESLIGRHIFENGPGWQYWHLNKSNQKILDIDQKYYEVWALISISTHSDQMSVTRLEPFISLHFINTNIFFPVFKKFKSVFVALWMINYFTPYKLFPHRRNVTSLLLLHCYFHGKCSYEQHALIPPVPTFAVKINHTT